jgi:hypothetical protein
VELEDSEEEIGVERAERHAMKSDSDSETDVNVGGGSGCAGGEDGNGQTEINSADCEHDDANLDVSGTGDRGSKGQYVVPRVHILLGGVCQ